MKPVFQTKVGKEGNCLAACLSSVLEIPMDTFPVVNKINWLQEWNKTLTPFNLNLIWFKPQVDSQTKPNGWAIGVFQTKNPKIYHAVLYFNGRKRHDPFPVKGRKLGKLQYWMVFTVLDPQKPINLSKSDDC